MATITDGTTTTTPDLTIGWDSGRPALSITHQIIRRSDPDVTLRAAGTRKGVLRLFYRSYTAAAAAEVMHAQAVVLTLTPTAGEPALGMSYVVAGGDVSLSSATDEARMWTLNVPYVQVVP